MYLYNPLSQLAQEAIEVHRHHLFLILGVIISNGFVDQIVRSLALECLQDTLRDGNLVFKLQLGLVLFIEILLHAFTHLLLLDELVLVHFLLGLLVMDLPEVLLLLFLEFLGQVTWVPEGELVLVVVSRHVD